jgi:hypothetical protein
MVFKFSLGCHLHNCLVILLLRYRQRGDLYLALSKLKPHLMLWRLFVCGVYNIRYYILYDIIRCTVLYIAQYYTVYGIVH